MTAHVERDPAYLDAAHWELLQTPVEAGYALGWSAGDDVLAHTGSNGLWLAEVKAFVQRDIVFLIVVDAGDRRANSLLQPALQEAANAAAARPH